MKDLVDLFNRQRGVWVRRDDDVGAAIYVNTLPRGRSRYWLERECHTCGQTFWAEAPAQKYCSRRCGDKAREQ